MYKLFYCDIELITNEEYEEELKQLPLLRRREILRHKDLNARKLSLAGDVLAKRAILELSGGLETPIFAKGIHKKPYCVNYPYHFNISHSKNYTVVAVSDKPIGVDVEVVRPFSAKAAAKILTEEEKSFVMLDNIEYNKNERFFKLWCAKEAYLKLIGTGISGGIKSLPLKYINNQIVSDKDINIKYSNVLKEAVVAVVFEK